MSTSAYDPTVLPEGLPVPVDDGACDHLAGLALPALALASTTGGRLRLTDALGDLGAVYFYPRTGRPGRPPPLGWDETPGARGCTPQSCGFRDHAGELRPLGARVVGVSAQSPEDQAEFADRSGLTYPLLSDVELELASALGLPTFTFDGVTLYKRVTLVAEEGVIVKVFYPVFPPDRNAAEVAAWLAARLH